MMKRKIITDVNACKTLWKNLITPFNISDIWEFRICFHKNFNRSPYFVVLEDSKGIAAMLPLSYLESKKQYIFFPGETWQGKSWLERTPIYLRDPDLLPDLLKACPENTCLRYLENTDSFPDLNFELDEISYTLNTKEMGYSFQNYQQRFSSKRLKYIKKDIEKLIGTKHSFHVGRLDDFEQMVKWNVEHFSTESYFRDPRFRESFRDVMLFLHKNGFLRMVSLEIEDKIVAVDIGAVYQDVYTIFIGGTDPGYPGVAKAINMNHLEFAFSEKISKVDFLCGDFSWKKLWHLDGTSLYRLSLSDLYKPADIYYDDEDIAMKVSSSRYSL